MAGESGDKAWLLPDDLAIKQGASPVHQACYGQQRMNTLGYSGIKAASPVSGPYERSAYRQCCMAVVLKKG